MTALHRDQIELRLIKKVEDFGRGYRQNLALLGRSGLGKTKILLKLSESIRHRPEMLPVYLSLKGIAPAHLTAYWIRSMIAASMNLPDSALEVLLESAESVIPKTCKAARHVLKLQKQGNVSLAVRELFALGGQLAEETGRKLVILLDELLDLEKFDVHDVYSILGSRLMMEKEAIFVVTSSDARRAQQIFSEKLSLLFSNFEILDVQPYGFREMNQLIDRRACGSYLALPARRFLFRLTDGEPRYLETLLGLLDDTVCADPKRELGAAVLFGVVIREVFEEDGRIALLFQKQVASFRRSSRERETLMAEAAAAFKSGRIKPGALASALDLKLSETKKLIQRMESENWLVSAGTSVHLRDVLFRLWAAESLAPSCAGVLTDEQVRRSRWTRRLGQIYEAGFESDTGRLGLRLEALLKLFKTETLSFGSRRIRCVPFHEISCSTLSEGRWLVKAFAGKGSCSFFASVHEIKEQDVENFWQATGGKKKPLPRVLIAAAGIEQNAKLFAQQNRMEIWDIRFFNQLLDYFGLAKVVIEKQSPAWDGSLNWAGSESLFSGASG